MNQHFIIPSFPIHLLHEIRGKKTYLDFSQFRKYDINALSFDTMSLSELVLLQEYLLRVVFPDKIMAVKNELEDVDTITEKKYQYAIKTLQELDTRMIRHLDQHYLSEIISIIEDLKQTISIYREHTKLKKTGEKINVNESTTVHDFIEGDITWNDLQESQIVFYFNSNFYTVERSVFDGIGNEHIVYPCFEANNSTDPENIDDSVLYVRMRFVGLYGLVLKSEISQIFYNKDRFFILKDTGKKAVSVVSYENYLLGGHRISSSHCQEGQGDTIFTLELFTPTMMTTKGGKNKTKKYRKQHRQQHR
jgi:hypothetical protein